MVDNIHDNVCIFESLTVDSAAVGRELSMKKNLGFGTNKEILFMIGVADIPGVFLLLNRNLNKFSIVIFYSY